MDRSDGAARLAQIMADQGLSQGAVERAAALSDGSVSRYLRGERTPDLVAAAAIERIYGVPCAAWTRPAESAA